jgi:YD repeat-containing protein
LRDPDGAGSQSSPVFEYTFDDAGRLTSVTDPLDRVTSYGYDDVARITSITLPDPDDAGSLMSPLYTFAYDAAGNLASQSDALGKITSFDYDAMQRLTSVTLPDPDGAGSLTAPVTTYAYPGYNFESHVPQPLNRKLVLEAFLAFREFLTEDRYVGMLSETTILNYAVKRHGLKFRWLAQENSKLGLYGSCPSAAAEIARLAEGKLFLNFDDAAYGPALQEFLATASPTSATTSDSAARRYRAAGPAAGRLHQPGALEPDRPPARCPAVRLVSQARLDLHPLRRRPHVFHIR